MIHYCPLILVIFHLQFNSHLSLIILYLYEPSTLFLPNCVFLTLFCLMLIIIHIFLYISIPKCLCPIYSLFHFKNNSVINSLFILILILIFQVYEVYKSHFFIKIYLYLHNNYQKGKANFSISLIIIYSATKFQVDGLIF